MYQVDRTAFCSTSGSQSRAERHMLAVATLISRSEQRRQTRDRDIELKSNAHLTPQMYSSRSSPFWMRGSWKKVTEGAVRGTSTCNRLPCATVQPTEKTWWSLLWKSALKFAHIRKFLCVSKECSAAQQCCKQKPLHMSLHARTFNWRNAASPSTQCPCPQCTCPSTLHTPALGVMLPAPLPCVLHRAHHTTAAPSPCTLPACEPCWLPALPCSEQGWGEEQHTWQGC